MIRMTLLLALVLVSIGCGDSKAKPDASGKPSASAATTAAAPTSAKPSAAPAGDGW